MELKDFLQPVKSLGNFPLVEKILIFGWYLHEVKRQDRFSASQINQCFDLMHMSKSANTGSMMRQLANGANKRLLQDSKGYRLSAGAREAMGRIFPIRKTATETVLLLRSLQAKIQNQHQQTFLAETIVCYENGAYRAAIVMAWNLAYHHACDYVLQSHLKTFNAQLKIAFPKKNVINKHSDFEDLREAQVIDVAKGAQIFSVSTSKVLSEKLGKRNTAAHPSSVVITDLTAQEVIADLVQNILLRSTL
jgi:hypothetical protein